MNNKSIIRKIFVTNEYQKDIPSVSIDVFKKLWAKVTTKTYIDKNELDYEVQ